MTLEKVIKKAIRAGWDWRKDFEHPKSLRISPNEMVGLSTVLKEKVFLSPLFWQSLAKSLNFSELGISVSTWKAFCSDCQKLSGGSCGQHDNTWLQSGWKILWHRFIDHLIQGKNAESFFETL